MTSVHDTARPALASETPRALLLVTVMVGWVEATLLFLMELAKQFGLDLPYWLATVLNTTVVSVSATLAYWVIGVRDSQKRLAQENARYQAEARKYADLMRALDKHALVSIADAQGRMLYINTKFREVSGYTEDLLLGQDYRLISAGFQDEKSIAAMWDNLVRGEDWQGELCGRNKQGTEYWVAATVVPSLDGQGRLQQYITIGTEITEHKRLQADQRRLRLETQFLNNRILRLLAASPTVIYAFENPKTLSLRTFVSSNAEQIVSYPADKLVTTPEFWLDQVHPNDRSKLSDLSQQLAIHGEAETEYRFRKADGKYCWIRDLAKVIHGPGGQLQAIVGSWSDVTVRKTLEQELRRLRMAAEASIDMMLLTDSEGFIEYVNPSFCRFTGWNAQDIVGCSVRVLKSGQTPESTYRELWLTLTQGRPWSGRFLNRRKGRAPIVIAGQAPAPDPRLYWVEASITPICDADGTNIGYVSIQRDISAQVAEEERQALLQQDNIIRLHISDVLHRAESLHDRCAAVLDSLFELYGLDIQRKGGIFLRRQEAEVLDMFVLRGEFTEEFIEREREVIFGDCLCGRAAVSGKPLVSDDCFCDPRHEHRFEGMSSHGHYIVPLTGNGQVLGVLFLYTDPYPNHDPARIEMLRQLGEMIGLAILHDQAAQTLQAARDAAYESSRLKSGFLANMSHEIRTPMNGVLGMLELLQSTALSGEQQELAGTAYRSAEALLVIINDILDFSKIEAGKLRLETIDFDARQLTEEVCALLAARAHAKRLELNCFVEPHVPDQLRGDPTRLRQILTNLIGNAIKFTEQGEVSVEVVCAAQNEEQATLRFSVRDTGIGIEREVRERLFQPFVQADIATTRRFGGTGLGLSIAKDLVERMSGNIGVDSEPGRGSVFWFTVVLPKQPDEGVSESVEALVGKRVLVVDDNATNRRILACFLEKWGAIPSLAGDAHSALDLLRSGRDQGLPYQLAILDLNMPDRDGLALARDIAAEPGLATLPRILLSSGGLSDDQEWKAAGILKSLNKPVRQAYLRDALVSVLGGTTPKVVSETTIAQATPPAVSFQGRRILLVEDNTINQIVAKKMFERLALDTHLAKDGLEALEALAVARYELVFMDCQMPNLDGYEATRRWRATERAQGLPHTPIVALTANALTGESESYLAVGMDDYMTKPFTLDTLIHTLTRWLQPQAATATHAIWDEAGALEQAGDDPELLGELLQMLAHGEAQQQVGLLREALDTKDAVVLRRAAHSLKGMAGQICAAEVQERAECLESVARRGAWDEAGPLTGELVAAVERLCVAIETWEQSRGE